MPVPAYEAPRATPIYSFAALKTKQREIKDRAAEEVVHITENGNAAYIFCSEDTAHFNQATLRRHGSQSRCRPIRYNLPLFC